jgi:hypothetical protein
MAEEEEEFTVESLSARAGDRRVRSGFEEPFTVEGLSQLASERVSTDVPVGEVSGSPITAEEVARLGLELAGGVGAVALTKGRAAPAVAARIAPAVGRFAPNVARGLAAFGGGAAGSLASETFDPSEEPFKRAAIAGAAEATGEAMLGPAISRVFGGGTSKSLVPGGAEFVEDALAAGLIPSPGRASTNRAIDITEAIGESSFFGGSTLLKASQKVTDLFDNVVKEFVDTFRRGASKEAIEDLTSEAIENSSHAFREAGTTLYNEMDRLISETAAVDFAPLIKRIEEAKGRGLDPSAANRISRLIKNRVAEFGTGNLMPFAQAHQIRSELLGIGRQSQALIAAKAPALGKELSGVIDDAMETAAKKAGGGIETAWRNADKFWREGKEVFNSNIIKALTRREPQSVFAALRRADPRTIRKVRNTLKNEDLWKDIQGQFLLDMMQKSETKLAEVSGEKFLRSLKNFGDDALREIFSRDEITGLRRVLRNLDIAQGKIGEGIPGRIFIQLAQAGAAGKGLGIMFGLSSSTGGQAAAGILAGPAVAAKLFTNKKFIKWATLGVSLKPGTKQAINAFSQMMALAIAEGAQITGGDQLKPARRRQFSATLGGPGQSSAGAGQQINQETLARIQSTPLQ